MKVCKNEKQLARKQNASWHKTLRRTGNNIDLDQINELSDRQKLVINIIETESSVGLGKEEARFKINVIKVNIYIFNNYLIYLGQSLCLQSC